MSESSITRSSPSYSLHYRQGRRRWVPKGVMLLAVLFVVGLLGACQNNVDTVTAAIAVPDQEADSVLVEERCVHKTNYLISRDPRTSSDTRPNILARARLNAF